MNIFRILRQAAAAAIFTAVVSSCQKGDLTTNNNVTNNDAVGINPSLFLNHITYAIYKGGGVLESVSGNLTEEPWGVVSHYNQYYLSNYSYYQSINTYNWSNSATHYDMLKYVILMEKQAASLNPTAANTNIYAGLAKFFRAYSFIWLAQRVGDIPMTQAGSSTIEQPEYDSQKTVYVNSLKLLDEANTIIAALIAKNNSANTVVDASGDIFGLTYLQWQKIVNTYKLRVLISLSKRADDNSDMNIKSQFAAIINDPTTYPVLASNSDNMVFKYVSTNAYPIASSTYSLYANIGSTYLNITTANADPRTFKTTTPAPAQITAGKTAADFSAYVGADPNLSISQISENSSAGQYSFANYNYYSKSNLTGSLVEPEILIGYPELCFNIAEAANRGWITADAATWYGKGIDASLSLYGLTEGQSLTVNDKDGNKVGTVTVNISNFKTNVAYKGGEDGLKQILEQKYVAFFQNSGWEAFYNQRRTGYPAFAQGGAGIGTANNKLPRRWQYPLNEKNENAAHCNAAIQSQFGGTDDVMQDTWLTK
ncbi:Starch-binding associating with outer membrane [Filimonas lacunae]|uniref:Starch-binding associating with outer membrane n=1 Tax=Filimonas lacunae TaxID=477680 RepID=A0A173M9C4_9BACT|nr:SusD/RagB family nutrient-binding outer membrane lipoprotein [Filimonas lacunae]BAV04122.1 hypothetical protein FLA_0101 [Filimonas lacunae]SIT15247.1 Starch-binding associating with outer membrane [Filimonas lacunae]